jgi:hypothetical protein
VSISARETKWDRGALSVLVLLGPNICVDV